MDGTNATVEAACSAATAGVATVAAVDDAGNRGFPATVDLAAVCGAAPGETMPAGTPAVEVAPAAANTGRPDRTMPATGGQQPSLTALLLALSGLALLQRRRTARASSPR